MTPISGCDRTPNDRRPGTTKIHDQLWKRFSIHESHVDLCRAAGEHQRPLSRPSPPRPARLPSSWWSWSSIRCAVARSIGLSRTSPAASVGCSTKGRGSTDTMGNKTPTPAPATLLILSGSYGYLNGIFQNTWFNCATGRSESMLFDETVQVINQGTVNPGEDSSPRNFYGSTVGDELRMSNGGKSRVVVLAIKECGALLLGGRTGTAYFFNDLNGEWTTLNVLHERRCRPGWSHSMRSASPISGSARSGHAVCPRRSTVPSPTTLRGRPINWASAEPSRTRSPAGSRSRPASTGRLSRTRLSASTTPSNSRVPPSRARGSARMRSPTSWRSRSARPIS